MPRTRRPSRPVVARVTAAVAAWAGLAALSAAATPSFAAMPDSTPARPAFAPHSANPVLPGYYADPTVVQDDGKIYVYATLDPWGGKTLGCWESADWKQWTYRELNWPTKAACTSPTSAQAMVWAPSVVKGPDGRFHMVVSVGSEVWAGVADNPLGPWKNALGDKPLIPQTFNKAYHMIDAELFVDDDGAAYLYWGSGFNWVNGKCFAVKLKPDFVTFDGDVHDVTPTNYFEAPFLLKRDGRYYLTWSSGNTTLDTYQVHYGVAQSPFGPFVEGKNSPILVTDKANDVISPGHHTIFQTAGQTYVMYHRHSVPFDPKFVGRQTCVDELNFDPDGGMKTVVPTHAGPALVRREVAALPATFTASSQATADTGPARAGDDNYATRWAAAPAARGAWLTMDLGRSVAVKKQQIRFEYAWKPYRFAVQSSDDGQTWHTIADHTAKAVTGSPVVIDTPVNARYLRLAFPVDVQGSEISVWEWLAE